MSIKKVFSSMMLTGAIGLSASTAFAEQAALDYLTNESGVSLSCTTCHTTSTGPVLDLVGIDFKAAGGSKANNYQADLNVLGLADSDGDLINNALEVFAGLDPNTALLAVTAQVDGYTYADQPTGGVTAIASMTITPAELTASTGVTLGSGQVILGDSATQLTLTDTSAVTMAVTAKATGTVKVHQQQVSNLLNVSTVVPTVSATGSVTFTPIAVDIYAVVESTPYTPPTTGDTGGGSGGGCVTSSIFAPISMALAMLSLGFFVRRKKD